MSGYVFHDINVKNHGQTLKIPWYLLNETCTVIHYMDCYGKDSSKKLYQTLDERKYRIGNVCSLIANRCCFCQFLRMTKNGWKETKCASHVEEIAETCAH